MSAVHLDQVPALVAELRAAEGDGTDWTEDLFKRAADALTALSAAPDWRVLGGLVPGVINAAWLRDGDKIRLNKLDGVVHLHTVSRRDGVARFVFVTDTGQVRVERALDAEILVLTPSASDVTGGAR